MQRRRYLLLLTIAATMFSAAAASAQDDDPITRLERAVQHTDTVVDTALAFTNLSETAAKVRLVAFDSRGTRAGEMEIEVPANGLTYVLASELVHAADPRRFLGKVVSRGGGRLTASAVLFGGALTDVPTIVSHGRTPATPTAPSVPVTTMTFPLVVTY